MKTLNIIFEDKEKTSLNKAKENREKAEGKKLSWREFVLTLVK